MSQQPKQFYKQQSLQYMLNDLMPKAIEKRDMNEYFEQLFTKASKLKQTKVMSKLPMIIEPTNLSYQLVPQYKELISPRSAKMVEIKLKHESAIPAIVKDVKIIPVAPKVPTYQMLQILYEEKRSKITNVKSAVPINFVSPSLYTAQPPPVPSREMIKIMYQQKRQRLSNIRSAIPLGIIDASNRVKPPLGKVPDQQTLNNFFFEKRQKLTNIQPAIPLQLLKSMNKMQQPSSLIKPPQPDAIKDFLHDKKQRISNVKQAIPQCVVTSRPKVDIPTEQKMGEFLYQQKHKISNVRSAIEQNQSSYIPPPQISGPSHDQIKSFFFEKNERLSNVRTAIPFVLLNPKLKPPEFSQQKLMNFQQDRKMKIENVKSALPQIFIENAPAPPQISDSILKQYQYQQKHHIKNVESAIPSIPCIDSDYNLPDAPNEELLKMFYEQQRSKITNVRPAIAQNLAGLSGNMTIPPPPQLPVSLNKISQFFEEKKLKISNVRSAINNPYDQNLKAKNSEKSSSKVLQFQAPKPVPPPPVKQLQNYISSKNLNKLKKYSNFGGGLGPRSLSRASLGMMSYAPSEGMYQPHQMVHHPSILSQDQASWIDDLDEIEINQQDYREVILEASDVGDEFSKTQFSNDRMVKETDEQNQKVGIHQRIQSYDFNNYNDISEDQRTQHFNNDFNKKRLNFD